MGKFRKKAGKNENENQDEKISHIKGLHIVIVEDDETSFFYLGQYVERKIQD